MTTPAFSLPPAPAAVIFDLDGLLIDSEPLWVRAEQEVFAEVGVTLTPLDCATTKGLRIDAVVDHWFERRPWSGTSPRALEARLCERVAALLGAEGVPKAGAREAVALARRVSSKVGLATSSPLVVLEAALARLDLVGAFDVLASAQDESHGKPHPAVFLTAAERLGAPAPACVVLEDSLTGLVAAKAARMRCVVVPEDFPAQAAAFALADRVRGSLRDLVEDDLRGVFG